VFGEVTIVRRAQQADVAQAVIASHREGMAVMEFHAGPLGTATPLIADEAAPATVALVHRPANRCRNVS